MLRRLLVASCLNAPLLSAPALAQETEPDLGDALTQPLRDLSILRPETPEVLQRAVIAPYADAPTLANGGLDCAAIDGELESLDLALGEDLAGTNPQLSLMVQARTAAGNAMIDAVGDFVQLPYRSVIRRVTGAHRRDRERREAVQAGVVRRAFLKGMSARECSVEPQEMVDLAPPPQRSLSDLELAHLQLASANNAAAARTPASFAIAPDGNVGLAATDGRVSEVVYSPLERAEMEMASTSASDAWTPVSATISLTVAATEAPLSDLALARRQLAAANAAAAARLSVSAASDPSESRAVNPTSPAAYSGT